MITSQEYREILDRYREGCVFCEPDKRLVVADSPRFRVCYDAAPLAPGHVILHSKDHFSCAGDVPLDHYQELLDLRDQVRAALRLKFGPVTSYEHGRAGHCLSDGPEHRLCHHFHLHFVPVAADVTSALSDRFKRIIVDDYIETPRLYEDYGDYLYFENNVGVMNHFPVDTRIERHLMRTLLSEALGAPGLADWRTYTEPGILISGMNTIGLKLA